MLHYFWSKSVTILRTFTIVSIGANLFPRSRHFFTIADSKFPGGFCRRSHPLLPVIISHSMASGTIKDEKNSMLAGALRKAGMDKNPSEVTDEEWARILTPTQYSILRQSDTEPAFTGEYLENTKEGMYHCAACGAPLFPSETKFESHCGWPAFYDTAKVDGKKDGDKSNVGRRPDHSFGRVRTEIYCKVCGSHLGHVFNDGPEPSGERHCVNSAAVEFIPAAVVNQ